MAAAAAARSPSLPPTRHDPAPPASLARRRSEVSLGFIVAWLNLAGSFLFLVASLCYFARVPPYEGYEAGGHWGWEYQVSEWGVRFTYGFGSFLFVVASLVVFKELDRNAAE